MRLTKFGKNKSNLNSKRDTYVGHRNKNMSLELDNIPNNFINHQKQDTSCYQTILKTTDSNLQITSHKFCQTNNFFTSNNSRLDISNRLDTQEKTTPKREKEIEINFKTKKKNINLLRSPEHGNKSDLNPFKNELSKTSNNFFINKNNLTSNNVDKIEPINTDQFFMCSSSKTQNAFCNLKINKKTLIKNYSYINKSQNQSIINNKILVKKRPIDTKNNVKFSIIKKNKDDIIYEFEFDCNDNKNIEKLNKVLKEDNIEINKINENNYDVQKIMKDNLILDEENKELKRQINFYKKLYKKINEFNSAKLYVQNNETFQIIKKQRRSNRVGSNEYNNMNYSNYIDSNDAPPIFIKINRNSNFKRK